MRWAEFRILGFPVFLDATILLLPLVYAGSLLSTGLPLWPLASFVVVLGVSVFVHELGHAGVMRLYGAKSVRITLHALGGATVMSREDGAPDVPARWRLAMILGGPVVGLALGGLGIVGVIYAEDQVTLILMAQVAMVNIVLNLSNLLPVFPLDGGQAVVALMEMLLPKAVVPFALLLLHAASAIFAISCLGTLAWISRDPFSGFFSVVLAVINLAATATIVFRTVTSSTVR